MVNVVLVFCATTGKLLTNQLSLPSARRDMVSPADGS